MPKDIHKTQKKWHHRLVPYTSIFTLFAVNVRKSSNNITDMWAYTHSVHTQTLYHTVEEAEALQNNVKLLKTVISELQQEKENLFQKSQTTGTCTCDCRATETAGVVQLKRTVSVCDLLKWRQRWIKTESLLS
ncbi:hypothetical protein ElyMa_004314000 [Elysia marginata]|uniref:Uncharacterized protein n=1 Tax=Elysia marginata TaxID=1093978 RepID=A0AAV4H000_9GAST|nr:hypothetical protein ElyMa_004314000 [Elysia marginata]